jgi:hypothetical protein
MKIKFILFLVSILLLSLSCSTNTSDSSGGGSSNKPPTNGDETSQELQHIWTQYNLNGTSGIDKPNPSSCFAMSYAGGSKLILFCANGNSGYLGNTWTWEYEVSSHRWTQYNII